MLNIFNQKWARFMRSKPNRSKPAREGAGWNSDRDKQYVFRYAVGQASGRAVRRQRNAHFSFPGQVLQVNHEAPRCFGPGNLRVAGGPNAHTLRAPSGGLAKQNISTIMHSDSRFRTRWQAASKQKQTD